MFLQDKCNIEIFLTPALGDFDLPRLNMLSLCLTGVDHVLTLEDFDLTRFNI